MATKWYRQFPEIAKAVGVEFPNVNHSTKTSRNSGSKVEWKENFQKKIFENFGISREVVLFFRNFGKCCSVHYWKL